MQERENAFFKHLKTGITIIHEMRKLLLCDLDTVLLYSKKLVKKCPPFHSWKLLTGVLRIYFLMEIVKVLSICSTNKLFTRWESFCFATLIQSCSIVNSWLTNAPLSFMKTSNRGTENAFFNGNVEEVLSICPTNNSTRVPVIFVSNYRAHSLCIGWK